AGRLRTGVHQPQAAQIILSLMMIDDDFGGRQAAEKGTEIAQLVPGSRIHNDHGVSISPRIAGFRENLNSLAGVQKAIARRKRAGDDQAGLFVHLSERFAESEDGADAVAVGPNVGGQQKSLVTVNKLDE